MRVMRRVLEGRESDGIGARAAGGAPLLSADEVGRRVEAAGRVVDDEGASPEESACIVNRLLFFWAFPTLWRGYRRGRTDLKDLPPLPSGDRPAAVIAGLPRGLAASARSDHSAAGSRRRGPPRLLLKVARTTRRVFLQAMVCQALLQACTYAQPILLHAFLTRLTESTPEERRGDGGAHAITIASHAVGIALAVMGQWIFAEYGWTLFVRADLRAQVAISHMTYRKSLMLPVGATRYTLGDLQNHFATDCTRPMQSFIHASHSALVEACLTLSVVAWHLTSLIGSAGVVAMVIIAAFGPVQLLLSRRIMRYSRRIQICRDVRGRLCSQFLSAMRVVKCFMLEETAMQMVSASRDDELRAQWGKRTNYPFNNFVASTTSLFGTIAAFSWMELVLDQRVDPALAFTVLTWNNILKNCLISLPNQVATMLDVYVSLWRIEDLLACDAGGAPVFDDELCGHSRSVARPDGCPDDGPSLTPPRGDAEVPAEGRAVDFALVDCSIGFPIEGGHRGIHKLTLTVHRGELVLIVGPIGAGKSVLLEGLAGTRAPLSGTRATSGRSKAYVSQKPWLLNATVLENITFGRPENEQELSRALGVCALCPDLSVLPDGLATLVGEEGVQLSGGQKQRVSLARAVYSRADVILMDDVLSALDAHVGRHVWEQAICEELAGRTRILVTHQVHFCSHPAVDRIVVLNADGAATHQGSFDELTAQGVDFGAVFEGQDIHEENSSGGGGADAEVDEATGEASSQPTQPAIVAPPVSAGASNGQSSRSLSAMEGRRVGSVMFADLVAYAKACGGLPGISSVASLIILYYGFQLASSLQLAAWANANVKAEEHGESDVGSASKRQLFVYLGLCFTTGVTCFCFFFGIQLVALRGSRNVHVSLMKGLLHTDLRFFDLTPTGRALNRCLKDMATIDDSMPALFRALFESFMNVVTSTLILGCFAWEALFAVPPFAAIYFAIMSIYRWPARDLRRLDGVSRSPAMCHYADTIRGATTIRAYGHEARFLQENLDLLGANQKTTYWFWVVQGWVSMSQEVLGTFLLAVVAAVVGLRASSGALSPGVAGLCLSYAMSMPRDLMWLSRRLASIEVELVSIERIMEYVRLPDEETAHARSPQAGEQDGGACVRVLDGPAGMAISARALKLRYDSDAPLVLNGLTLDIPVGARAALVGRTGCGKSSLLSALARLYPTSGGGLFVHGHSVRHLPLGVLRSMVRVLLQDPIFFTGTIRSNLLCRPPSPEGVVGEERGGCADEDALWLAIRQAGLEERVRAAPQGLDARVEESGQNFSQGERQLLCLARVLVSLPGVAGGCGEAPAAIGPRLLLCDEPTSACDAVTDEYIHETLLHGLPREWTLVVVCHRLRRIREFDHVFLLEGGAVAESGSPQELLSSAPTLDGARAAIRGRGAFAEMCRQQGVR